MPFIPVDIQKLIEEKCEESPEFARKWKASEETFKKKKKYKENKINKGIIEVLRKIKSLIYK